MRDFEQQCCIHRGRALALLAVTLTLGGVRAGRAQSTTRLVLSSGTGVPGHAGFVFGPFSGLAMNEARDIVFLTSLRSARIDLRAVVRSSGVTFSVVAFQGLRSPVPKATYDSFSVPSMNASGEIVFTAELKDEAPASAVIRLKGGSSSVVATSGDVVPGMPETTFQEFSAPLINSAGNILFSARTAGKSAGTGLFLWTRRGTQRLALPPGLNLSPSDVLEPVYFSHDEAVFAARGTPPELALDQFFRALAVKSFQELNPPPAVSDTYEVLPVRPGDAPVKMLLALFEGENVQTVPLLGDPAQAVAARRQAGVTQKPLGRVMGQTVGAGEKLLFAATSADTPAELGLYCYCDGEVIRLKPPEEFMPVIQSGPGRPILSLCGDSQQTLGFIAPGAPPGDSASIYVTSLP